MTYTEKHLDQIDANFSRPSRNGDIPRLSHEISDDAELKEAAKDVEMLWQATRLERLQGKLEMLKEYERKAKAEAKAEEEAEEDKKVKVISKRTVRLVLSVAAGVLLMVAVGWYLFKPEPIEIQHQYLAEHFGDYILHDVMMGENPAIEFTPDQVRAYDLFAIQDFKDAIPLLKKEWEHRRDHVSLFYLWVSYKAIGDEKRALQYQEEVIGISEFNGRIKSLSGPLIN